MFTSLKFKSENTVKYTKSNLKEDKLEAVVLQTAKWIAEEERNFACLYDKDNR